MKIQTDMHQFYKNLTIDHDITPYKKALLSFRNLKASHLVAVSAGLQGWFWSW